MDRPNGNRALPILLCAFMFVFGMEMVRFHFASLGWYQRDTLGVGAIDLIPVALVPFIAGVALPLLSRILSMRVTLWLGAGTLVAARILVQAVADPAVEHWASGVAVAAFVGSLVILSGLGRRVLVAGVLVGITIDTAIKAHGVSLDLAFRPGWVPLLTVVVIAAAILYLVTTVDMSDRVGPGWRSGATLIGLGPFLFAQYLVLQSQGWVSELTGLSSVMAALGIVALDVAALWLATRFDRSPALTVAAALIVGAALILAERPGIVFGILVLLAIPLAGPLWAALVPDMSRRSLAPSATYLVVASVTFLALGFAYYLPLDLDLGFTQPQVRVAGALLIGGFGLASAFRRPVGVPEVPTGVPALAALALLLPASAFLGQLSLPPAPDTGPLRVMSYNIHQSFGTAGDMDVEAVADVIVDSGATVVGVQELARGGLLNAGTDLLALLGQRLGWEHVAFFGTTDPVWGNAILSRYPLGEVEREYLPMEGTPFRRGYLAAPVDLPIGEVLFISTHLQHINDPDVHDVDPEGDLFEVHTAQIDAVLGEWGGREPAVLVGDFNARPDWRQIQALLAEGWVDSWEVAGSGPGYTTNAADPRYRIDYVFHTEDLTTQSAEVVESQASDHFAVLAELASGD